jgi:lipoprotein NlpI
MTTPRGLLLTLVAIVSSCAALHAAEPTVPTKPADTAQVAERLRPQLAEFTTEIVKTPDKIELYSRRGDAHFFLAEFSNAVADYDKMVAIKPEEDDSHWRRGIAYFYAGQYEQAAGQFERYHSFDNVDRENGIWRYLSQVKAYGRERARQDLLKYEKDDRQPFPDVYQLFAGKIEPDAILKRIEEAEITDAEREKRRFYAHLYIGLNYAVEDQPDAARVYLAKAASNKWPERAGYGAHYMWHVARLHRDILAVKAE